VSSDEIAITDLIEPIITRWRLIIVVSILCSIFAILMRLLLPESYEAQTTFIPEPPKNAGFSSGLGLASLAGQLGISTPNASTYSPEFFAALLRSREILKAALMARLPDPRESHGQARPLLDLLELKKRLPSERMEEGIRWLLKNSSVAVDRQTAIVALTVRTRYATLSADVANNLVATLDSFNIQRRQSQSHEERRFTERRLADARHDLRLAEDTQLQFLDANRTYAESPQLRFRLNRLERDVQLKQEVYVTLSKAYEEARIAEVQDTPLLTVIDRAEPPVRPSTLSTAAVLVIGALVGVFLSSGFVLVFGYRAKLRTIIREESSMSPQV
jgi:uncharacterized protein involved in exopolysaccharide biosynthesis